MIEDKNGMLCWIVKPSSLLQLDISHPATSSKLLRYPRISNEYAEQIDGKKYKRMEFHWAINGNKEFYLGDFVVDHSSVRYGRIVSFFEDMECHIIHAELDVYKLLEEHDHSFVYANSKESITLDQLSIFNPQDYQFFVNDGNENLKLMSPDEKDLVITKSWFREMQKPVISIPINLFFDDTSANSSRKWKPLHCIQMQAAGIPNSSRQQHKNVKFIAASSNVSILELMKPVVTEIKKLKEDGILAFDATLQKEVILTSDISACICDFNMLSEAANHMGPNTNKYCPRCYADPSTCKEKGITRTPANTKRIFKRLELNNNNKEMRQRYGLKAYDNCLWDIIDPHSDIPVGQLHWLYLGIGKHILKLCIAELSDQQTEKLTCLIDTMDSSSFKVPVSSDIIRYLDSRQGKDIKNYLQIAPFHMALVGLPIAMVKVVCKIAELSKIFSQSEFYEEEYLTIIDNKIEDFLQRLANVFPSLLNKVKIHLSTHIVDDIRNHGPPKGYLEDAFEKMHGRIRSQLFIQNQHAISRDSAIAFVELEILQHIVTGGYFKEENVWVQAGTNVQEMAKDRHLLSFLGWSIDAEATSHKILKKADRSTTSKVIYSPLEIEEYLLISPLCPMLEQEGTVVSTYRAVTTVRSQETAKKNSPVLYVNSTGEEEIGLFVKGMDVKPASGKSIQVVQLQMVEKLGDVNVNGVHCESVGVIPRFIYVLAESV